MKLCDPLLGQFSTDKVEQRGRGRRQRVMIQLCWLCLIGVVLAAGCSQAPTSMPVPVPTPSATEVAAVPFPVLSPANVLRISQIGTLQSGQGAPVACSPQQDVMAVGDTQSISVYQASTLAKTLSFQTDKAYPILAVSPDGQRIAGSDAGANIQIWDSASGKTVRYLKLYAVAGAAFQDVGMYAVNLAFGPAHWIVVGAAGKGFVLGGDTGQVNRVVGAAQSTSTGAAISADGQMVALANAVKGTVSIWSTADGHFVKQLPTPTQDWLTGLAFSADGNTIVAGDETHGIYFWDVRTGQLVSTLAQTGIPMFALNSDGTLLFGVQGSQVAIWEVKTGKLLRTVGVSAKPIQELETCVGGRLLLAGDQMGSIGIWGVKS